MTEYHPADTLITVFMGKEVHMSACLATDLPRLGLGRINVIEEPTYTVITTKPLAQATAAERAALGYHPPPQRSQRMNRTPRIVRGKSVPVSARIAASLQRTTTQPVRPSLLRRLLARWS